MSLCTEWDAVHQEAGCTSDTHSIPDEPQTPRQARSRSDARLGSRQYDRAVRLYFQDVLGETQRQGWRTSGGQGSGGVDSSSTGLGGQWKRSESSLWW